MTLNIKHWYTPTPFATSTRFHLFTRCVNIFLYPISPPQGYLPVGCAIRMHDAYTDDDDVFVPLTAARAQLK